MTGLPDPPPGSVVVPIRAQRRHLVGLPLVVVGSILAYWSVGGTRWQAVAYAAVMGAFLVLWLAILVAGRRRRGSWEDRLVLTDQSVSTSTFALDWDDVERITIGQPGRRRALTIEPVRWEQVRWADSAFIRLNARFMSRTGGIRILEVNLEESVLDLARQMEEKAGRTLFADTIPDRESGH